MGGNELPTSFTNINTYQKIQRRRRKRTTTATTTTIITGEVRFFHLFNHLKERERERERERE